MSSGPNVVVAVAHPAMRALIVDLVARDHGRWAVAAIDSAGELRAAVASLPDLVVVDAADLGGCCGGQLGAFQLDYIVVIGPDDRIPRIAGRHSTEAPAHG